MPRRDEIKHDYRNNNYSLLISELESELKKLYSSPYIAIFIAISVVILVVSSYWLISKLSISVFLQIIAKEAINIIEIFVIITGLIVLNINILSVTKEIEKKNELSLNYQKQNKSIDYISDWQNHNFYSVIKETISEITKSPGKAEGKDFRLEYQIIDINLLENNPSLETKLTNLLNFLEQMSMSIHYKLADEDILLSYFRDIVMRIFPLLEPWIIKQREINKVKLYLFLEELYYKWR